MSIVTSLGPIAYSVTLVPDLEVCRDAYCKNLHLSVMSERALDEKTALALGIPALRGAVSSLLANTQGHAWLWLVNAPGLPSRNALRTHGWLAQEILVADIDSLAANLDPAYFTVLRPPADLDVSDRIRASQVRGPAGEVLYLTQVQTPVPPFDLPVCEAPVDHLFIPVLSTPDRDESLAEYAALADAEGMRFDTRITVVNQEIGLPLETRHPVGTLQLAGQSLIEIDQIEGAEEARTDLSLGTAAIIFHADRPAPPGAVIPTEGPLRDRCLSHHMGAAGEHYSLLYQQ